MSLAGQSEAISIFERIYIIVTLYIMYTIIIKAIIFRIFDPIIERPPSEPLESQCQLGEIKLIQMGWMERAISLPYILGLALPSIGNWFRAIWAGYVGVRKTLTLLE